MIIKNNFSFKQPFTSSSTYLHLIGVVLTILGCFFTWQQTHWADIRGFEIYISSSDRMSVTPFDTGRLPSLALSIFIAWMLFIKRPDFIKLSEAFRIVWAGAITFLLSTFVIYFNGRGIWLIILCTLLISWLMFKPPKKLTKPNLLKLIGVLFLVFLSIYLVIDYRAWMPGYYSGRGIGLNEIVFYFDDSGGGLIILFALLISWLMFKPPKKLTKPNLFGRIGAIVLVCLSIYFMLYYKAWMPGYYGGRGIELFITLIGSVIVLFSSMQGQQTTSPSKIQI